MYGTTLPLTHRPARDGSIVDAAHVPAYLALELATQAWALALDRTSGGSMTANDVMVVNIDANFSRELLVGTAEVGVSVTRIGRSSTTVQVSIAQGGHRSALVMFVLVRVMDGSAQPLTSEHVAVLESLKG